MTSSRNGMGTLNAAERNRFFYGKLMDAEQFEKDQTYFNHKRSIINRFTLGSGVVCGLNVEQGADAQGTLSIGPGLAIDGLGREIVVAAPVAVDPRRLTNDRGEPEGEPIETGIVELRLAYAETNADLVPVLVADCDASERCAASTIREGFRVLVRSASDEVPNPPACGFPEMQAPPDDPPLEHLIHRLLSERIQKTDLELPEDSSVRIARVELGDSAESIVDTVVGRQLVYSNALLYELLLCLTQRVEALANGS